jgi:hypothetical protein
MWLRGSIIDRGGDDPVFRVEVPGDPRAVWEGSSPSRAWLEAMKAISVSRTRMGATAARTISVSGPEYYGFTANIVLYLFSKMENSHKCDRFKPREIDPRDLELDNQEAPPSEVAAPVPQPVLVTRPPSRGNVVHHAVVKHVAKPIVHHVKEFKFDFRDAWKGRQEKEKEEETEVFGANGKWLISRFQSEHHLPVRHQNPLQCMLDIIKREVEEEGGIGPRSLE